MLFNQPADRALAVTVMLQDPFDRYDAVFVELRTASGAAPRAVRLDPRGADDDVVGDTGRRRAARISIQSAPRRHRCVGCRQ